MRRMLALILAVVAASAMFAGLVYSVLVAAHLSEPAANTVHGLTPRRVWATAISMLALVGVVSGALALARTRNRFGSGRIGIIAAVTAGSIAVVNGGLNLVMADGGPGSGNGVVGGAAAFVLGLTALALGLAARVRRRRAALGWGESAGSESVISKPGGA